jgi:hypothetical protein
MLVVVEDGGGLANRLFVFSNAIATGLSTGHRVANPAFRSWADSFEGTTGDRLSLYPRRRWPFLRGEMSARIAASLSYRCCRLLAGTRSSGPVRAISLRWPEYCDLDDPLTVADLQRRRLVLLKGWLFRNRSGVERCSDQLRDFFRPVETIRRVAERAVDAARQRSDVLVGVHVRHRDYRRFMDGRYFYRFAAYVELMRSVAEIVAPRDASFLVCSDEVQDLTVARDLHVTASTMGPVHDLWALSRCDLLMGPPSTFSAWAGFLGRVPLWEIEDRRTPPSLQSFVVPAPVPKVPAETP